MSFTHPTDDFFLFLKRKQLLYRTYIARPFFLCFFVVLFFCQCIGVRVAGECMFVPGIAQHSGMALYYVYTVAVYLVQRSCLCRSFVTTELVSLLDEESARILGVWDVDVDG